MEKVILIGIFTEYKKMDAINLPILFALLIYSIKLLKSIMSIHILHL